MSQGRLNGNLFASMITTGAEVLSDRREEINDLNVFPIPDGDTGDNMYMTIESGLEHMANAEEPDLGKVASLLSEGMLLGARGNSGVILSRMTHGFATALSGLDSADISAVSDALCAGSEEAYSAVSNPVEGTILSVFRDATRFAKSRIRDDTTMEGFFNDLLSEMRASLSRTPDQLAVLAEAGVVDSGGAGLLCIFEGMNDALNGRERKRQTARNISPQAQIQLDLFTEDSSLVFGYCTEFLLRLQRAKTDIDTFDADRLTADLAQFGDSIVCFRDGSIVKVHIHTFTPGDVLNFCQQYGEFLTLKIENMTLQHSEAHSGEPQSAFRRKALKPYGIVAVASGAGIKAMFASLGCDQVIEGGQSMNPEVEDFIRAFEETSARTIFVYPNNGNVLMAAEQAAELYQEADIRVIPTRTVGEGYAAVSMLDTSSGDPGQIVSEQRELIRNVKTGFVSRAVRDTAMNGISIHKDDYIGFSDNRILADHTGRENVLISLAEKMDAARYDVMMLIFGANVTEADCAAAAETLRRQFPHTEVVTVDGGQPIHDYILVLE